MSSCHVVSMCLTSVLLAAAAPAAGQDPLPSWNDTDAKQTIVAFVEQVTDEDGERFVPEPERIAVFDNDGTLWAEQPFYFQAAFAIDAAEARAARDPEAAAAEPFRTLTLEGPRGLAEQGEHAIIELVMATHAGTTADAFQEAVRRWLAHAEHPQLERRYATLVYQPQLELLDYLREHGFKTFIVSGGGVDFLRVFAEEAYGIPPEQVIGSSIEAKYEVRDGVPVILKQPAVDFVNDKAGKPVGIHQHIGRRPILAVGNSDGDFEMLEYTTTPRDDEHAKPALGVLIHHDDSEREWAYDRDSPIGKLDRGLDEAAERGWVVVSMARDWRQVFPAESGPSRSSEHRDGESGPAKQE